MTNEQILEVVKTLFTSNMTLKQIEDIWSYADGLVKKGLALKRQKKETVNNLETVKNELNNFYNSINVPTE